MNYSMVTKLFISVITTLMLTHLLPISAAHLTLQQPNKNSVEQFAEQWKQELAKAPSFDQWKTGSVHISPLGPGTHSWIAFVKNKKTYVGYMIIHATEDNNYVLGEYGLGDEASINEMSKHSEQIFYHSPTQALIIETVKKETNYIDLFTLEQLPLQAASLNVEEHNKRHGIINHHASVTSNYLKSYFSPFDTMPWLTSKSINTKLEDCTAIEQLLKSKKQIRFVTSVWDDLVEQIYSVTGYQKWGKTDLYLAIQQDNEQFIRYIPFEELMNSGSFYE